MAMLLRSLHLPMRVLENHGPTSAIRRVNRGPASESWAIWLSMRRVGAAAKCLWKDGAESDAAPECIYSGSMSSANKPGPPLRRLLDTVVNAHLEDLQAEMEAGSHRVDVLADRATEMREAILHRHLDQAALAGALLRRVAELRRSVTQQQEQLRELRHAIRAQRDRRQRQDRKS